MAVLITREKVKRLPSLAWEAIRLVWESARGWTILNLALVALQGVLPLASLLLIKVIVDSVSASVAGHEEGGPWGVFGWIALAGGVWLLGSICRSLSELAQDHQSHLVTERVTTTLHEQSARLDLDFYENSENNDTLHRAQHEATFRPTRMVSDLAQIGQNALSISGIAVVLFSFNHLVALLVLLAAVPAALTRLLYSRRLYEIEEANTSRRRKAWYYHLLLTHLRWAAELRLLGADKVWKQRAGELRQQVAQDRLDLARQRLRTETLSQTFSTAAVFGALAFICKQALSGAITLGGLVMYYQAFQTALGSLQNLLRGFAGLYENSLFLTDFRRFLSLRPVIGRPVRPAPVPARIRSGIAFEDVSFSYQGCDRLVLDRVSLEFPAGRVVALVGENGAGKSTLIKLLARLYDPSAGRVTVDGIDLRELDPIEWRRKLSVVLQDFGKYAISATDNIWVGDVERAAEAEAIGRAANLSGVAPVIGKLAKGYATPLGREFEYGSELSAGEWQKLVLARALWRESAEIIVLDEPTSSMDSMAESELFCRFRSLIGDRSAILISHRFSTVQMADEVAVIDGGRIVEHGTHTELLRLGGRYATMYESQSRFYV